MLEQEMKFSVRELHVKILKAKPSRKRKRGSSHEVVTKKIGAKTIQERVV